MDDDSSTTGPQRRGRDAACYLRVSSKSQTIDMQRAALVRCAAARGDTLTAVYTEKRTAKQLQRPELDRLRQDAQAGRLPRRLYVFRLDRLTRSGIRDTLQVIEELRACGIDLVSATDGFDLNGPAADIILAVMAWAAKMERLAINERIAAARDRVETEGGTWGRQPRLAGAALQRARELQREGRSVRQIAIALKVPKSSVGRALSQKGGPRSAGKTPSARTG